MVRYFHLNIWLRVLAIAVLTPFLLVEPFFTKVVLFSLPLFVLLAFIAELMRDCTLSKKMNAYILITSLYLIGIISEGSFFRTVVAVVLVISIYAISVETT